MHLQLRKTRIIALRPRAFVRYVLLFAALNPRCLFLIDLTP
jgi:hypothetical protein